MQTAAAAEMKLLLLLGVMLGHSTRQSDQQGQLISLSLLVHHNPLALNCNLRNATPCGYTSKMAPDQLHIGCHCSCSRPVATTGLAAVKVRTNASPQHKSMQCQRASRLSLTSHEQHSTYVLYVLHFTTFGFLTEPCNMPTTHDTMSNNISPIHPAPGALPSKPGVRVIQKSMIKHAVIANAPAAPIPSCKVVKFASSYALSFVPWVRVSWDRGALVP